jgi:hypothetical protein
VTVVHIEIVKDLDEFQVRVVDAQGQVLRRFTYARIERARSAAIAWAAAYRGCEIKDLTKGGRGRGA